MPSLVVKDEHTRGTSTAKVRKGALSSFGGGDAVKKLTRLLGAVPSPGSIQLLFEPHPCIHLFGTQP